MVTCVIRARFFTRPQLSPSGVSAKHSMPHWLGCRARGPLTCEAHSRSHVRGVLTSWPTTEESACQAQPGAKTTTRSQGARTAKHSQAARTTQDACGDVQRPIQLHMSRAVQLQQYSYLAVRTFLLFSNWDVMRVIMPTAAMKLSRLSTCTRNTTPSQRHHHHHQERQQLTHD